jgi:hypothetical protein
MIIFLYISFKFTQKDFGIEGYSLWVYLQNIDHTIVGNLVKLKILKSSTINNCSMVS